MDLTYQPILDKITSGCQNIFSAMRGRPYIERSYSTRHVSVGIGDATVKFVDCTCDKLNVYIYVRGESVRIYSNGEKSTTIGDIFVAKFSISTLDGGCSGVFGGCYLESIFQNKGFGVKLHELRLEIAKEIGFLSVIATSAKGNERQNKIFRHFSWNSVPLDNHYLLWFKSLQN